MARCDRMLGRLALAAGDTAAAGEHLAAAAGCFRDGDYLTELAVTLADLAEHARVSGDLDAADRYAAEAITIAAPRGLVPAQSAALAARARIRAAQATAAADPDLLLQGRDAADAALRLATRHQLDWHELGRAARPRRPRPGRGHRPRVGRQSQRPARPAGPARPGPRPAGHRRTARRRPETPTQPPTTTRTVRADGRSSTASNVAGFEQN